MIILLAALFLIPELPRMQGPNPEGISPLILQFSGPVSASQVLHTRWRTSTSQGEWVPPRFKPPAKGAYWISAAVRASRQSMDARAANSWALDEGLSVVQEYRRQYKMQDKGLRIFSSTYAKALVLTGESVRLPGPALNLPIEFLLLTPTTLQVNFRGKPIGGIQVKRDGKIMGRSNGLGQLVIPAGGGRFEATVVRPYPDRAEAEWEAFTATLVLP